MESQLHSFKITHTMQKIFRSLISFLQQMTVYMKNETALFQVRRSDCISNAALV